MTRVLWLTTGLGRGGVERLLVDTAARISQDLDITIAYVLPWKHALVREATEAGATVTCVGVGRPPADPRWIFRLRRLLRDGGFDVVHTHAPLPAAIARLVAPRGTVLMHTEHNLWPRYRPLTRVLNAMTWRRNRHVLAVSDGVAASIRPPRPSRAAPTVEVLVQGIEMGRFATGADARALARRRLGIDDDAIVIGTVGNLVPKKDHATLLHAADELPRDVHVVIAGTGPLEDDLRRQAATMSASVHLLGMRDDVPALLPGFDVFCMSSRFEGLPIALLEAMAAAVPVVATAVGGVPEVVTDGVDGLLVPPGEASVLANAIGKVLDDPGLAHELATAGRSRATAFSLDNAVRRTVELYRELAPC